MEKTNLVLVVQVADTAPDWGVLPVVGPPDGEAADAGAKTLPGLSCEAAADGGGNDPTVGRGGRSLGPGSGHPAVDTGRVNGCGGGHRHRHGSLLGAWRGPRHRRGGSSVLLRRGRGGVVRGRGRGG